MILKEYYTQFYANKLDNLHKMDKFLERHKQLKLTEGKIENLKRPIIIDWLSNQKKKC